MTKHLHFHKDVKSIGTAVFKAFLFAPSLVTFFGIANQYILLASQISTYIGFNAMIFTEDSKEYTNYQRFEMKANSVIFIPIHLIGSWYNFAIKNGFPKNTNIPREKSSELLYRSTSIILNVATLGIGISLFYFNFTTSPILATLLPIIQVLTPLSLTIYSFATSSLIDSTKTQDKAIIKSEAYVNGICSLIYTASMAMPLLISNAPIINCCNIVKNVVIGLMVLNSIITPVIFSDERSA